MCPQVPLPLCCKKVLKHLIYSGKLSYRDKEAAFEIAMEEQPNDFGKVSKDIADVVKDAIAAGLADGILVGVLEPDSSFAGALTLRGIVADDFVSFPDLPEDNFLGHLMPPLPNLPFDLFSNFTLARCDGFPFALVSPLVGNRSALNCREVANTLSAQEIIF
jgi:hypothetical protein